MVGWFQGRPKRVIARLDEKRLPEMVLERTKHNDNQSAGPAHSHSVQALLLSIELDTIRHGFWHLPLCRSTLPSRRLPCWGVSPAQNCETFDSRASAWWSIFSLARHVKGDNNNNRPLVPPKRRK